MVPEKENSAYLKMSVSEQWGRSTVLSNVPAWDDDTQLDRAISDLVVDPDGDDLTYSVVCQNCPGNFPPTVICPKKEPTHLQSMSSANICNKCCRKVK